jgi:hypothetical protein
MSVTAREFARAVCHSVPSLLPWRGRRRLARRIRAAVGLSLATLRYAGEALWGLVT